MEAERDRLRGFLEAARHSYHGLMAERERLAAENKLLLEKIEHGSGLLEEMKRERDAAHVREQGTGPRL